MPFFSSKRTNRSVSPNSYQYKHKPLPSLDAPYIRLLRLEPTRNTDQFVGTLKTFLLDDPELPVYTALSYAWGSLPAPGQARHKIDLIGELDARGRIAIGVIELRQNLYSALLGLRPLNDHHHVWIDSICINQDNDEERSHQVKMIGKIYSNAQRVIASLPSEHDTARDQEQIKYAFWVMKQAVQYQPVGSGRRPQADQANAVSAWFNSSSTGISTKTDHLLALESLATFIARPYWTRLWIVQEVIIGRTVSVQYETDVLSMQTVEDFFHQFNANPYDPKRSRSLHSFFETKYGNPGFLSSPVKLLSRHRRDRRHALPVPDTLTALLPLYATNQCKEPEDHVYGMYNLLGAHRAYLTIDYGQDSFCRVASILHFMQKHERVGRGDIAAWAVFLRSILMEPSYKHPTSVTLADLKVLNSFIATSLYVLGNAELMKDCGISQKARKSIPHMPTMGPQQCLKGGDSWQMSDAAAPPRMRSPAQQDLQFFAVPGSELYGLADSVERKDLICQLAGTSLAVVMRLSANNNLSLISFATLFTIAELTAHSNGPLRSTARAGNSLEQGRPRKSIKLDMPVSRLLIFAEQACLHDERHPVNRWKSR